MDNVGELKNVLVNGNPMLFLGAGFSYGGINSFGNIPTGKELAKELFENFIKGEVSVDEEKEILTYSLPEICQCIDVNLEKREELRKYLVHRFKAVEPREFHLILKEYPWKRIYTVNIDDLVENIYKFSENNLLVQNTRKEKLVSDEIEYIKLHGCVNEPNEPFVFSKTEYTNLISSKINFKLNNLIADIQRENFIFIGASLAESDIDFYISQYENAGYFRKGKLIFVDPNPSMMLKGRVKELSGIIIEWTAEQFLEFVQKIGFRQNELEQCKVRLNYSGIFLYKDIIKSIKPEEVYESRLYEGYNSNWRDLLDGWIFETPILKNIKEKIDSIDFDSVSSYAIAIHGNSFVGKDCLVKQIGIYLDKSEYEVLEFKGKYLDIKRLQDYICISANNKFALLIENASYYYKTIENLLQCDLKGKKLVIITSSRNYYHFKKRYYLEGNPFAEFLVEEIIDKEYAKKIYSTLKDKGYIGHLSRNENEGIQEILRSKTLINLFTSLTYGLGFKNKILKSVNNIFNSGEQIKKLYIELALFDKVDLPYYPSDLLCSRYSIDFNIFGNKNFDSLSPEQAMIVDFVRIDENGVSIKNKMLVEKIWNQLGHQDKISSILEILICIAPYVSEYQNNYWRIIFESLLKEDCLEKKLKIGVNDQLKIYYQVKKDFEEISYFWLQLGIAEQRNKNYEKALNHLSMAKNIRPRAYQIQHAIARNYLKHANSIADTVTSEALFTEGEKLMEALINSREFYKAKARNFSIHCYILEKTRYILKKKPNVTNKELLEMKKYIDFVINEDDTYVNNLISEYVNMLKKMQRLDILRMNSSDKYFKALSQKALCQFDDSDILVDSY